MDHIVGKRIAAYRERLELSTEELAKLAGLDLSVVRAIESEQVYPSIGILIKLARALGQRLGTFLDDQYREDPLIIRKTEQSEEMASHRGDAGLPYCYYPLGRGKTDRHMEPFFVTIDPRQPPDPSSHEGEEFIMVLSGEIELLYGTKQYRLQAGDSMYYNSIVPHGVGAAGEQPAELCAVIFMPL